MLPSYGTFILSDLKDFGLFDIIGVKQSLERNKRETRARGVCVVWAPHFEESITQGRYWGTYTPPASYGQTDQGEQDDT